MVGQDLLFSDTFERPDSLDLDAAADGMTGPLAPMTYGEPYDRDNIESEIIHVSCYLRHLMLPEATPVVRQLAPWVRRLLHLLLQIHKRLAQKFGVTRGPYGPPHN